jgi:hypothetical protein
MVQPRTRTAGKRGHNWKEIRKESCGKKKRLETFCVNLYIRDMVLEGGGKTRRETIKKEKIV